MEYREILIRLQQEGNVLCQQACSLLIGQRNSIIFLEKKLEQVIAERNANQKRLIELEQELVELRKEQK